jgi:hypothetical protein
MTAAMFSNVMSSNMAAITSHANQKDVLKSEGVSKG